MTLKLREGWEVTVDHAAGIRWIHPTGACCWANAYASISNDGDVRAYPFGGAYSQRVESVEAAHEHLSSVGSQSPWEVTP